MGWPRGPSGSLGVVTGHSEEWDPSTEALCHGRVPWVCPALGWLYFPLLALKKVQLPSRRFPTSRIGSGSQLLLWPAPSAPLFQAGKFRPASPALAPKARLKPSSRKLGLEGNQTVMQHRKGEIQLAMK